MRSTMAAGVIAGVLGLAVTGAAALAAFQPTDATSAASVVTGTAGTLQTDKDGPRGHVKDILDKLVSSGTITQTQEQAILKAFADAAQHDGDHNRKDEAKHVLGDLFKLSGDHLGIPLGQLKHDLASGKSLGEVANATSGRSRDGLIQYLVQRTTAQIDKAVADGKLTKERADAIKTHLADHVTKFVDHKVVRKPRS